MGPSREILEKRAVKTGIQASKKRHHLVSEEELLALRIQVMPWFWRAVLILLGSALLVSCSFGWPWESWVARSVEALIGVLAILSGAFGIRKTLSNLLDTADAVNGVGSILEMIADAVSGIDL